MKKLSDIKSLLDDAGVNYELTEHQPTYTSKQAEDIAGFPASCGAKSIVFKLDNKFVLVVVRGTNRADFNKLRKHFGVRKARLATPEEVLKVMGVRVGACYPFPSIAGLSGVVDESLSKCEEITFSPGTAKHHVRIKWADYEKVTKPVLIDIAIKTTNST